VFKKYCEFCKKEIEFKNQQAYASHIASHKIKLKSPANLFENLIKLTEQQLEIYKQLNQSFSEISKNLEIIKEQQERIIQILTYPKEK
jgi:transcription-repair coupling factor (superfamily II helicase)